jgi:RNA polymerase sigma factor (sigma-70 family)
MSEGLPNTETAYRELRPVFFKALGKLARQGFVVSPADTMDLIHDFFAEGWPEVEEHYAPDRGDYKRYAYRVFVNFVRPRIVSIQRLQNYHIREEEVERSLEELSDKEQARATRQDEASVRWAMADLPEMERTLLSEYINAGVSERQLAQAYSLSKYKVRGLLVDALGRVVVTIDRPQRMPEKDWKVALALWKDGRSVEEAARYLGMTKHQLRAANARNLKLLEDSLGNYQHPKGQEIGRQKMSTRSEPQVLSPEALFETAVKTPGDGELLRQLAERACEVIEALDRPGAVGIPPAELEELDQHWLAEVYAALGAGHGEEFEAEDEIFYAHREAEYEIGLAYKQALVPGLPPHLADLAGNWLSGLPRVGDDEAKDALNSPSGRGAHPLSERLAQYGVSPLVVFDSTEAVARLLDRFIRRGKIERSSPLVLTDEFVEPGGLLHPRLLIDEISRVADCREQTAGALYRWGIRAAGFRPLLFGGFEAEASDEGAVRLYHTGERVNNLFERWGRRQSRRSLVAG